MIDTMTQDAAAARRRALVRILVANTILCLLAIVPAFLVQIGAVMGGAAPGAGSLGSFIAIVGLVLPAVPIVSIAGSWLSIRWRTVALAFVALPWMCAAVLGVAILVLFLR